MARTDGEAMFFLHGRIFFRPGAMLHKIDTSRLHRLLTAARLWPIYRTFVRDLQHEIGIHCRAGRRAPRVDIIPLKTKDSIVMYGARRPTLLGYQ